MYFDNFADRPKDNFLPLFCSVETLFSLTLHHHHSLPGISFPSDPVPGEPLLRGAADSNGATPAIHPGRQTPHQAPQ